MRDDKKVVNRHLDLFSCQFHLCRRCGYVTKQIPRRTIHKHPSFLSVRRMSTQEQSASPPCEWDRCTIPCNVTFLWKLRLSVTLLSFCRKPFLLSPNRATIVSFKIQFSKHLLLSEEGVHKSYLCLLSPQSSSR